MPGFSIAAPPRQKAGDLIPHATPHAVSVALPTFQDNIDYEEGHERIKQAMTSGYPRFFIHHQIQELAQLACAKFGQPDEQCILLPSLATAQGCQAFLLSRSPSVDSRLAQWTIKSSTPSNPDADASTQALQRSIDIHICFVAAADFPVIKQYWQHTGDGISSRVAERCLTLLGVIEGGATPVESEAPSAVASPKPDSSSQLSSGRQGVKSRYGAKGAGIATPTPPVIAPLISASALSSKLRYSTNSRSQSRGPNGHSDSPPDSLAASLDSLPPLSASTPSLQAAIEQDEDVLTRYVEERYGRNLDLSLAPLAKLAMRRRIAGVLREAPGKAIPLKKIGDAQAEGSTRGVNGLTEENVWLYPGGMSAIFHAHQIAMGVREEEGGEVGKSVCFGFPYTDTLKILEKWGPGVHFLGHGLHSDLPALRKLCEEASPPILALFCEFPSNPLLRSPPLKELRALADEFGFMIVIDETIAGFVNVEVLPYADVVVSSLTKVFSGDSNVMGGSLVINPSGPHAAALKAYQEETFEDNYFDEDAIYMERNSRDFIARIAQENYNTERIADLLRTRRAPGPVAAGIEVPAADPVPNGRTPVITEVYYPKFQTPSCYTACLREPNPDVPHSTGFGALLSVTFVSLTASRAFFDALGCYKGPSLGTNFTLACPYTILAHYTETDWAKGWGVEKGLVRVSVGLEDEELLVEWFEKAIEAAEVAVEEEERAKGSA